MAVQNIPSILRILVVEDDEDTAHIIAADLKDFGLDVDMVFDGGEAIKKMLDYQPHLVVLDLELPNKNGLDIFQEMQLHSSLKEIPVVGNSVYMGGKDDLGKMFFTAYSSSRKEEPLYVNKLEAHERMYNNLTAVIGAALSRKYGALPEKLYKYLEKFSDQESLQGN